MNDDMQKLDFVEGLVVYGVYHFEKHPCWNIVITDMPVYDKVIYLAGFAFDLDGNFETKVTLRLPIIGKQIGYIYNKADDKYSLKLNVKGV